MKLGEQINKASMLIHESAIQLNTGNPEAAIAKLEELQEVLDEETEPEDEKDKSTKGETCQECVRLI